jgi:hypothetical protein
MAVRVYTYVKDEKKAGLALECGVGGVAGGQDSLEHAGINPPQFSQALFGIAALLLQKLDLFDAFLAADRQRLFAAANTRRQQVADFAEREAKPLALDTAASCSRSAWP